MTDEPGGVVYRSSVAARTGGARHVPADTARARWPRGLAVGSLAGTTGRLILESARDRETLAEYRARGGYAAGAEGSALIEAVAASGLVGRGGAAFPLAVKLRAVADRAAPRFVVANGEEGEPLSVKDRWLLRIRPHLVLDGAFRAAGAVDATKVYVYVSDPVAVTSVREALDELASVPLPVEIVQVSPAYVAGEETSVVRAINGGPALPLDKPPRPFEQGVGERPTLVSNVETLANLPAIATGWPQPAGTVLMTIGGAVGRPGLYEVPLGTPMSEVLRSVHADAAAQGALMGGYFAGLVGRRVLSLPVDHSVLRAESTGLGCGSVWVIGPEDCPVEVAAVVMRYFARNNARQCGPCTRGTAAMSGVVDRLSAQVATDEEMQRLDGWSVSLRGRGACAYLDGAAYLPATLVREFAEHVGLHRAAACPLAAAGAGKALEQRLGAALGPAGGCAADSVRPAP